MKGSVFVGAHCGDGALGDYISEHGARIAASLRYASHEISRDA